MIRRRIVLGAVAVLAGGALINFAVAWAIALAPRAGATRFATGAGPPPSFAVAYASEYEVWPPVVRWAAARGRGYERRVWSMDRFGEYREWSGRAAIGVPLHDAATRRLEETTGSWGLMAPQRAYWLNGADGVEEAFGWPLPALHGAWLRDADYTAAWRASGAIALRRHATSAAGGLLPLRPLPGFAANTLLYAAALAIPAMTFSRFRARLRGRRGRCMRCGYDAAGLARCPECGSARSLAPSTCPEGAP